MWRDILNYGRQLLELTQTVEDNKSRIKRLTEENKQLTNILRNLAHKHEHEIASLRQEMQHLRETERAARENEILRIENAVLRAGHQLPPTE